MRTLLLALILAAVAPAQGTRPYQLKNGDVIRAEIVNVAATEDQVRYRFHAGGGRNPAHAGVVTIRSAR